MAPSEFVSGRPGFAATAGDQPVDDGSGAVGGPFPAADPQLDSTQHRPPGPDRLGVQQWFQLCFEHAPMAMALLRADGYYEQVNPALCALLGYARTRLAQLNAADVIHPDDVADHLGAWATLVAGHRDSIVSEKRYLTPAGGWVWAAEAATLIRRPDGTPHLVLSQLTDISIVRQTEHAPLEEHRRLRRAETAGRAGMVTWSREAGHQDGRVVRIDGVVADVTEQLEADEASASAHVLQQAIITASPDIIYVWDLVLQSLVWSNRSLGEELGYSEAQWQAMAGDLAAHLVPDDARADYEAARIAVRSAVTDEAATLDLPMVHADGTRRWYSRRIAPLHRDGHRAVTHVVGVLRDTTGAAEVQNALRESEAKFRQLADNIDVAFTLRTWEPDAFLYVSPGYQKIFGRDLATTGQSPKQSLEQIHHEDQARFMSDYWAVSREGRPVQAEYRIVRPDGEVRWVRASSSPVQPVQGEPRTSAAIITDITDSRRAAAAEAAAQKAESASAAANEFLGRMSHELRTPLNAILGFAQLLELDVAPGPERDAVRHIIRGGRHMVSLVNDVLDIANIDGDRLEMEVQPVQLAQLLRETMSLMSPAAAAAEVELVYRPGGADEPWVRADARRLLQVLLNLLSNAIKYNHPNGQVEISCDIAANGPRADDPGPENPGQVEVVVRDTGRGIRSQDLPRLFTPFDRIGADKLGIEGSGVGLALSARLMSMMGGGLRASSQRGVGSSFVASLPLARPPQPPPVTTPTPSGAPGLGEDHATDVSARYLLYIEDVSSNVELMQSLLERRPRWRMVVAGHGRLGLELASTGAPDLILLDVHLPDLSGADVLRELRADPVTSGLPVVVLSADANPHQVERMIRAGADAYLTKPIDVGAVLALLDTHDPDSDQR